MGQASFSKENGGKRTRPARCARDHDVDALLYMRVGISKAFQNENAQEYSFMKAELSRALLDWKSCYHARRQLSVRGMCKI